MDKFKALTVEKLKTLGIHDNKYEVTLKFNEEDILVIASILLLASGFGFSNPSDFIKFILHQFAVNLADAKSSKTGKELLH